jgi:hypothetical protein
VNLRSFGICCLTISAHLWDALENMNRALEEAIKEAHR